MGVAERLSRIVPLLLALLCAAPARAVTWSLELSGGAGLLSNLPSAWTGEAYAGSISPTPTGATLAASGSAGFCGGYGLQLGLGIPLPSSLTLEIWAVYEALFAGYRPSSLRFTPQSSDALAGPMSLGLIALPFQLRYQLPGDWSVFAGAGPAVSTLALLVSAPSPETDFESRAFDVDVRAGGDLVLSRWGEENGSGVALGLLLDADTNGWAQALFVTVRLFSGTPDPAPRHDSGSYW